MSDETEALPYNTLICPEPGSPAWLDTRTNYIGGSDVAAVMGLNPYCTPQDVWMDKTGRMADKEPSLAMLAGTFMEPFILSVYERATNREGYKPETMFQSKAHPWLAANLDWLEKDHQLLADAKRSEAPNMWGEPGTDEVPVYYFMQMQAYMLITGIELAEIAAWLPRNTFAVYPIAADKQIHQRIIETTGEFWDKYVKTDTPPPLSEAHAGSLSTIKRLYPTVEKAKSVVLPDATSLTIEQYVGVKAQIKALTAQKDSLEAIILDRMGDAGAAEVPGLYTLKRTLIEKKPYTVTPKPYTTLKIKEIKEDV